MLTLFQKLLKENEEEATISGDGVSPDEPTKKKKKVATNPETDGVKGTELGDEQHQENVENRDIDKNLSDEEKRFYDLIRKAQDMLNSPGPQDNWLDKFLTHFSNILALNSVGDLKGHKEEIKALQKLDSLRKSTQNKIKLLDDKINTLKGQPGKEPELKKCQELKLTESAILKKTEKDMLNRFSQLAETRGYYARNKHNKGIIGRFLEKFSVQEANLYNNKANPKANVASTKNMKFVSKYDLIAPGSTAAATLATKGATLAATVVKGLYHGDLSNRLKSAFGYETTPPKIDEEQSKLNKRLAKKNQSNYRPNKPPSS